MSKDLGKRLKELRKQNNLNTDGLAEKLSVRRKDVENWEDGKISPDGEHLIKLSHIYQMPIDEILLNFDTDSKFEYTEGYTRTETVQATQSAQSRTYNSKQTYNWYMFPYPILVVIVFIVIGFFFNVWHPTWLLFLTIPIYYLMVTVNNATTFRKKANVFPYPIICVLFYLTIGFDYNLWHPSWLIFLTIPIYYMIVNGFKNK